MRNKNLEDINMLRIHLENKIEDLERQFDEVRAAPSWMLLILAIDRSLRYITWMLFVMMYCVT